MVVRGGLGRPGRVAGKLAERDGQGTTEYAILVGVLVVTNNH